MNNIPNDPVILLSFINTKLRDFYPNLERLCNELSIDSKLLTQKLSSIDYTYDASTNQFV